MDIGFRRHFCIYTSFRTLSTTLLPRLLDFLSLGVRENQPKAPKNFFKCYIIHSLYRLYKFQSKFLPEVIIIISFEGLQMVKLS